MDPLSVLTVEVPLEPLRQEMRVGVHLAIDRMIVPDRGKDQGSAFFAQVFVQAVVDPAEEGHEGVLRLLLARSTSVEHEASGATARMAGQRAVEIRHSERVLETRGNAPKLDLRSAQRTALIQAHRVLTQCEREVALVRVKERNQRLHVKRVGDEGAL